MPDPDPCVKSSEMTHCPRKLHLIMDSGAINVIERRQGCEKEKNPTALSVVICRSNSDLTCSGMSKHPAVDLLPRSHLLAALRSPDFQELLEERHSGYCSHSASHPSPDRRETKAEGGERLR